MWTVKVARLNLWPPRHHRGAAARLDVFPLLGAQGECAVGCHLYGVGAGGGGGSDIGGKVVAAVGGSRGGQRGVEQRGERGDEVDVRNEGVGRAFALQTAGPTHDERHGAAGLESAVFSTAPMATGTVGAYALFCFVSVAIVEHGAVVAGDDEEGVVAEAEAMQGFGDFAYGPVELQNGIAAKAHAAATAETLMRIARHVDVVGAEVEEERLGGVALDELNGVVCDGVGYVLVLPKGFAAALHVADAPNAVDHGLVVPMAGTQLAEQFGVGECRWLALEGAVVAHGNGRRRVVVGHAAVLNVDTRHAVGRGSHDVMVVEAQVGEVFIQLSVPVLSAGGAAYAEVPLADGRRGVAVVFEEVGHGELLGFDDEPGIAGGHVGAGAAERILAREESVARWRAGRGTSMGIGEAESAACYAVGVRCFNLCGAVAREIAVAEVVCHKQNNVGALAGLLRREDSRKQTEGRKKGRGFHRAYIYYMCRAKVVIFSEKGVGLKKSQYICTLSGVVKAIVP